VNAPGRNPDPVPGQVVTACPACGASNGVAVGEPSAAVEATVGGRLFLQPAFAIACCPACGLYFKSQTLSAGALDDYYRRLDAGIFDVEGNFPTDLALRRTLDRLPEGSRVLDFGCSTGRLVGELAKRHACYGVEVNERAAEIARARGIRIVTQEVLRSGGEENFDAIILTDVYEHLLQPLDLLVTLVNVLKQNGMLAIVTGNADAISTRDRMAEFWYFQLPGHLHMMSERHVGWLAERLGLRVETLLRCSHYDTPRAQRVKQQLQSFAYHQFRRDPGGWLSAALRFMPGFRRAEHWKTAPAQTGTADHVVAVFRKP
jgi:SAM-dependent methyltransferase